MALFLRRYTWAILGLICSCSSAAPAEAEDGQYLTEILRNHTTQTNSTVKEFQGYIFDMLKKFDITANLTITPKSNKDPNPYTVDPENIYEVDQKQNSKLASPYTTSKIAWASVQKSLDNRSITAPQDNPSPHYYQYAIIFGIQKQQPEDSYYFIPIIPANSAN